METNTKLSQQMTGLYATMHKWEGILAGCKAFALANDGVVDAEEKAQIARLQGEIDAIKARIVQISSKKGIVLEQVGASAEPPSSQEILAPEDVPMGLGGLEQEDETENTSPGIVNIGNIDAIRKESGIDEIIAVLGVTPHDTLMDATLLDAVNTFINVDMRLSQTKGYIALIAANTKSWKNSDYRVLVTLTGRNLSLGSPYKSTLWVECEQSIGVENYTNLRIAEFYFTEDLKISTTKEHTHKIIIASNDSEYQQSYTFPTQLIENYGESFLTSPKFQDKARLAIQTKVYGNKSYLLTKDLAPKRNYTISTFDGNDKPILVNSVLTGIKAGQSFIVRVTKTKDMVENPSANELLNEQLSKILTDDITQNKVEGDIAEMDAIGFGFSLKAGKEVVNGGSGLEAYIIATRGGQPTKVNVSIKNTVALFSFSPSLWINAIGDVYISNIEYDFFNKNIDIKL